MWAFQLVDSSCVCIEELARVQKALQRTDWSGLHCALCINVPFSPEQGFADKDCLVPVGQMQVASAEGNGPAQHSRLETVMLQTAKYASALRTPSACLQDAQVSI